MCLCPCRCNYAAAVASAAMMTSAAAMATALAKCGRSDLQGSSPCPTTNGGRAVDTVQGTVDGWGRMCDWIHWCRRSGGRHYVTAPGPAPILLPRHV